MSDVSDGAKVGLKMIQSKFKCMKFANFMVFFGK